MTLLTKDVILANMAQCSKCLKNVGCGCNLKDGLCLSCRQQLLDAQNKSKIPIDIKLPKKDTNNA
jgi:hypothetical protein